MSAVRVVIGHERGAGMYGFFNNLLFTLLCLDLYWFYVSITWRYLVNLINTLLFNFWFRYFKFIVKFLYKIATGQLKELEDIREIDVNEDTENKKTN